MPPPGPRRRSRLRDARPDIEGLRALAVLAVVLCAVGVPATAGGLVGVDVFLVVSGFLLVRHLLTEVSATAEVDLLRLWGRRARRVLPAVALVAAATLLGDWLLGGPVGAADLLRHYWPLAVGAQVVVVWPLALGVLVAAVQRTVPHDLSPSAARRIVAQRTRAAVAVLLGALSAVCVALHLALTTSTQAAGFSALPTRVWEPALGGLVAVAASRLGRLGTRRSAVLTWTGALALGAAVSGRAATSAVPDAGVLLAVLGAAAILAGGCAAPRGGVELVLGRAPLRLLGALAFGWYLWQWPLLQLAPALAGQSLDLRHRVLVALAALTLAAATYALLEHPARALHWPAMRPVLRLGIGLALTSAVVGLALAVSGLPWTDVRAPGTPIAQRDVADDFPAPVLAARPDTSTAAGSTLGPSAGASPTERALALVRAVAAERPVLARGGTSTSVTLTGTAAVHAQGGAERSGATDAASGADTGRRAGTTGPARTDGTTGQRPGRSSGPGTAAPQQPGQVARPPRPRPAPGPVTTPRPVVTAPDPAAAPRPGDDRDGDDRDADDDRGVDRDDARDDDRDNDRANDRDKDRDEDRAKGRDDGDEAGCGRCAPEPVGPSARDRDDDGARGSGGTHGHGQGRGRGARQHEGRDHSGAGPQQGSGKGSGKGSGRERQSSSGNRDES